MGAKPSLPGPNTGGRVRAYSSSDVPSSTSGSGSGRTTGLRSATGISPAEQRVRYQGTRPNSIHQSSVNIPNSSGHRSADDDTDGELDLPGRSRLLIGSLPAHLSPHLLGGFHCPVCSKFVTSDEMDLHLVMCLTKPRLSYNEDVLSKDAGECAICLEEMEQGDTIARLPCLCIYHKGCIDEWFEVNRSCPEHPSD